jgi:hypothetical protein
VLPLPCAGLGHLTVRVLHRWTKAQTGRDNFLLSAHGSSLAAPLIERLLELPMDIHAGSLDGELHIAAYDDATWNFPAITGKLACRGEQRRGGAVAGQLMGWAAHTEVLVH